MRKLTHQDERWIILLIGAIQFVNILDFMMVMPLGPDFATALGIPTSELGLIGGSYTASASIVGIVGSFFLDRFDRRRALFWCMLGLSLATMAGGLATGLNSLIFARCLAGAFGGPATALSLSVIADIVPVHRRGRAMGAVMTAFSAASIFGVPAGLELSRLGGWRLPFFSVGGLCLIVMAAALSILPPMRGHLKNPIKQAEDTGLWREMRKPEYGMMIASIVLAMLGAFMVIPNIATYFLQNLGYPRDHLGMLYFVGGIFSLVLMSIAGKVVDRFSATSVVTVGATVLCLDMYFGFYRHYAVIPAMVIFVGFMGGMSIRGVAFGSLASRVPRPHQRASYMSIQSSAQHLASAAGATLATRLLSDGPNGKLLGMSTIAMIVVATSIMIPLLVRGVESRVRLREQG